MAEASASLRNGDSGSFWDAAADGQLVLQSCADCSHVQFPPRHVCAKCWSLALTDTQSAGDGVIESVTVVRRAPIASYRDKVPYVVVSVILAEGPRMITNLEGANALGATIGDRVVVTFTPDGAGNILPQFRLAN